MLEERVARCQPRLLLVSVDVQDYTDAVIFDSYKKQHANKDITKGEWYSEYGHGQNKHVVFYDGIGLDQVLASALGKYALEDMISTHTDYGRHDI